MFYSYMNLDVLRQCAAFGSILIGGEDVGFEQDELGINLPEYPSKTALYYTTSSVSYCSCTCGERCLTLPPLFRTRFTARSSAGSHASMRRQEQIARPNTAHIRCYKSPTRYA